MTDDCDCGRNAWWPIPVEPPSDDVSGVIPVAAEECLICGVQRVSFMLLLPGEVTMSCGAKHPRGGARQWGRRRTQSQANK